MENQINTFWLSPKRRINDKKTKSLRNRARSAGVISYIRKETKSYNDEDTVFNCDVNDDGGIPAVRM